MTQQSRRAPMLSFAIGLTMALASAPLAAAQTPTSSPAAAPASTPAAPPPTTIGTPVPAPTLPAMPPAVPASATSQPPSAPTAPATQPTPQPAARPATAPTPAASQPSVHSAATAPGSAGATTPAAGSQPADTAPPAASTQPPSTLRPAAPQPAQPQPAVPHPAQAPPATGWQMPTQAPAIGQATPTATTAANTPRDPAAMAMESFYRLQPSDTVFVRYRYTPEYDATVAVRPDGYITLPMVGEVRVAGLTVANAQREIVKQASVRLRDPELTVELKDFLKPNFVVGGEVTKPGQYELRGRVTLLQAIAMAGGLKTSAKHSQVVLFRRYDDERVVTRVVNAKQLAHADAMIEDPVLVPGDFLFVPQNNISKVERFMPIASIGWMLNILLP